MRENEEDLLCALKHKLPVLMVVCDIQLKKNQKLLCSECMDILESKAHLMSFKKVFQKIEENKKQKKESVENVMMMNIKQLEQLYQEFHKLKSNVVQQLDQLIGNVDEWIKYLQIFGQQNITYSFFDELDEIIKQKQPDEFNQKSLTNEIIQINQSWNQKIIQKLNLFKSFQESLKCEEILKVLTNVNQMNEMTIKQELILVNQDNNIKQQNEVILVENQQNQLNQQLMMDKQVELKLIDDSNKQFGYCQAIVFDQTGSIMISSKQKDIQIWDFEEGRLKLCNTYQVHTDTVLCLVSSLQRNSFISGSADKTIICWQKVNQKEWKCSQPFQQHSNYVNCLLLNKQENQLISGGSDSQIKVWQVDFIKNELKFLYSLDKHIITVESLSFNQSETVLASCGYSHFIIWEKGQKGEWVFKYSKDISSGHKLHFINDKQFIWVTKSKDIDDILVFEQQNGEFKQNSNKTIKLIQNNESEDYFYFPIIYNKNKNMILVRHKYHIYLIRQLNDGTFKIIAQLNCQIETVIGTMTNNGCYLVFWDKKFEKYSTYEILNK